VKTRHSVMACTIAAMILAAGVCPLMAWDYSAYASPETGKKSFVVNAGTDPSCHVCFKWDAPCKLMMQVKDPKGILLPPVDLNNGAYLTLKNGGTFTVYVWSESGSCNWGAMIADLTIPGVCDIGPYNGPAGGPNGEGAGGPKPATTGGGSVTDLEGETPSGTADCAGLISHNYDFSSTGNYMVDVSIDEGCTPQMSCFEVGPGMKCVIDNCVIDSGGYNCATGAHIDDPGLTITKGCCTEEIVFSFGIDENGKEWYTAKTVLSSGKYTLMANGGRRFSGHISVTVVRQ